ncbi:hypothetical protein [Pseudomonas folii]|nr:hypothetical protein [Pseudomonas folii]
MTHTILALTLASLLAPALSQATKTDITDALDAEDHVAVFDAGG